MMVADGYEPVKQHVEGNEGLLLIAKKTQSFLSGFYSDFALELLSSVDYIMYHYNISDREEIAKKLKEWSNRKQSMFSNPKYLDISIAHIQKAMFVGQS
jgi:hypothetical protein